MAAERDESYYGEGHSSYTMLRDLPAQPTPERNTQIIEVKAAEARLHQNIWIHRIVGRAAVRVFNWTEQGAYRPQHREHMPDWDAWLAAMGSDGSAIDDARKAGAKLEAFNPYEGSHDAAHQRVDTKLGRAAYHVALWAAAGANNQYRAQTGAVLSGRTSVPEALGQAPAEVESTADPAEVAELVSR